MAKDKLTDYSATNASNTDVGGINIDEGMLPSAVNNSIRELMTHQKEAFGSGTPLYVDQTNNRVGISTASPGVKFELNNGGAGSMMTLTDGVSTNFNFSTSGTVGSFGTDAGSTSLALKTSGSEKVRITSGGIVGINTQSPSGANLEIFTGSTASDGLKINRFSSGVYYSTLRMDSHGLAVHVGDGSNISERAAITPNGITFNGATAAANALDDYEESTYNFAERNGQATITTHRCRVVKIGAMVYIDGSFTVGSNSNGNALNINLPFASTIGTNGLGGGSIGFSNISATIIEANLRPNVENLADNLFFRYGQNNLVTCSDASGKRIDFNVWYPVL